MKLNGNTGAFLTRGFTVGSLITIIVLLMAQSRAQGKVEEKIDTNDGRNTKLEARQDGYDQKWEEFIISQTALNTTLTNFVEQQVELNKIQTKLNGEFKEHIIRDE